MTKNEPPPKQLFTILFFLSVLFLPVANALAPESPPEQPNAYFKPLCPVSTIKPAVLASVASGGDLVESTKNELLDGLEYGTFLWCLDKIESNRYDFAQGDPYANQTPEGKEYCDNPLFASDYCAHGRLQFWQRTWLTHCEGDILNARDQFVCANKLLIEDWDNRLMWPNTWYKCLAN